MNFQPHGDLTASKTALIIQKIEHLRPFYAYLQFRFGLAKK